MWGAARWGRQGWEEKGRIAGRDGTRWESQAPGRNLIPVSIPRAAPRPEEANQLQVPGEQPPPRATRSRGRTFRDLQVPARGQVLHISHVNQPCFLGGSALTPPPVTARPCPWLAFRGHHRLAPTSWVSPSLWVGPGSTQRSESPPARKTETSCPPAPPTDGPISPPAS